MSIWLCSFLNPTTWTEGVKKRNHKGRQIVGKSYSCPVDKKIEKFVYKSQMNQ